MQNLETIENNLDKNFKDLFNKLLKLKMYDDAINLSDFYFGTKTNAYKRANQNALKIFNKQ